jgi:hypothetical protein
VSGSGLGALAAASTAGFDTGDGSPYGFGIYVNGNGNFFIDGTWAYRAP